MMAINVHRDGFRIRGFNRNGHDWACRFPGGLRAALPVQIVNGKLGNRASRALTMVAQFQCQALDVPANNLWTTRTFYLTVKKAWGAARTLEHCT